MVFFSVKNSRESCPLSRPIPDSLAPPKGIFRSRTNQQLTQTVPTWRSNRILQVTDRQINTTVLNQQITPQVECGQIHHSDVTVIRSSENQTDTKRGFVCHGPEAITSSTIFKKRGVKTNSQRQECSIVDFLDIWISPDKKKKKKWWLSS